MTASQLFQLVSQKGFIVDFSLDSKYAFYMQYEPIDQFPFEMLFPNRLLKFGFNSNNSTKFAQALRQKIYTKCDKICIFKKN